VADNLRVAVVAKLRALPGRGQELTAALLPLFDGLEQLPGTPVFCIHEATDDPDSVVFYELHRDEAAFEDADAAAAALLGDRLDGLLAQPPEITMCRPVRLYGISSAYR
jgi:quinol monooxygenase YgiN